MMEETQSEVQTPETPEETEKPSGKRKLPKGLLLVGLAIPLLAFQAFSSRLLVKQMFFTPSEPKQATAESEEIGEFYLIQDLIINPASTAGRRHLLVSLGLEYHEPDLGEELSKRDPQIRDNLITLLGALEVSALTDIRCRENIRSALLQAINYHLKHSKVDRLYFIKYVFQ